MLIPLMADNQLDEHMPFSTMITSGIYAGRNSRLAHGLEAIQLFTEYCERKNVALAVHLGDLFEAIGSVKIRVVDAASDALLQLTKVCKVIKLLGNHGRGDKGVGDHQAQAFRGMKNFTIVDSPWVYRPPEDPGVRLCFVPYQEEKDALTRAVEYLATKDKKKGDRSALFLHNWVYGGKGTTKYMPDEVWDPSPDLLEPFDITITGHLHSHQEYKSGGGKVFVVGSPYQIDLNDEGQKRGFGVLNTETMTAKHIPLDFPTFRTIEIEKASDVAALPDLSKCYVRFVIKNEGVPEKLLLKIKTAANKPQIDHDYGLTDTVRLNLPKNAPFSKTVEAYVAHKKPKASKERQELLTKLIMKMVKDSGAEL